MHTDLPLSGVIHGFFSVQRCTVPSDLPTIMDMTGEIRTKDFGARAALEKCVPIYVHSLRVDSVLDFDLYLYAGQEMVLYRASHLPFTARTRESLEENRVARLYVSAEHRRAYQQYIKTYIECILSDPSVDDFTKASIVYDSAQQVIRDVMDNPTLGENIKSCQALVQSTVIYVLEGRNAFHNMLRVMSFDYSLYSHSVNVCTFSLALAQAMGMEKTQQLVELGTGALLHDVGKIRVGDAILYKRGPLDDSEMERIRRHPTWGVEIIHETNLIPERSYLPIGQHHERLNGSGYPHGLASTEIDDYSKIVAIADVFDAMTTDRVYRSAVESFPALKTMFADAECFSREYLEAFATLLGPSRLATL